MRRRTLSRFELLSVMADEFDPDLNYPHLSRKLARSIGEFVVAWGILERELDNGFAILFKIDATLASCIYANLGTKAKLDILSSAFSMLEPAFEKEFVLEVHEVISLVREYSNKARNVLAHAQPTIFGSDTEKPYWQFARSVARKSHEMILYPTDAGHWGIEASGVALIAREWRKLMSEAYKRIVKLSPDDLDRICVTRSREIESKFQRSHTRRSPKKDGSRRRPPKRKQPTHP